MKRQLILVFACLLFSLILPKQILAQSDFQTSYDVTYTVNEDATTHAHFVITLTNKSSDVFASSYKLQLGFADIHDIKAEDPLGPIVPVLTPTANGQIIELDFNKHVVGINKNLKFNLDFDTNDIAEHQGKIWEINIPGLSKQNTFTDFTVHLQTPNDFGPLLYAKPAIVTNSYDFTKEQLGTSGISMAFGKEQIYGFSLSYHLQNSSFLSKTIPIALPPDTNYQTIALTDINPKPKNVQKDSDGNWIAEFVVPPFTKQTVVVQGMAYMSLVPHLQQLSNNEVSIYTKQQDFWQTQDSQIQQIAKTLHTPQDIYNYVVNYLRYDFSRVSDNKPRLGAAEVIRQPKSAVCLEFTDLFIAIARAKGIPARELDGFAYTRNQRERPLSLVKDILHAWPEYYDAEKKTWIMVDPTWGNTTGGVDYFHTLDLDHLVFAIKGESSTMPIPAGGYKNSNDTSTRDVHITFPDAMPDNKSNALIHFQYPDPITSLLPIRASIVESNTGSYPLKSQNVLLSNTKFYPKRIAIILPEVLPYGNTQASFTLMPLSFLTNAQDTITIQQQETTKKVALKITSYTTESLFIAGGLIVASICIITFIFAAATGRLSLFR